MSAVGSENSSVAAAKVCNNPMKIANLKNKHYNNSGPGFSIALSDNTFQGMAKMMIQLSYLGFIARYKFQRPTYLRW